MEPHLSEFTVSVDDRIVPVALWEPTEPNGKVPLVLVGHGGSGHKKQAYVAAIAKGLAKHHGIAAAAIDGPVHGDRRASDDAHALNRDFADLWNLDGANDRMNADWSGTLDHLLASGRYDADRVGYWGLSMGTMFGLPFVASEPRIKVAVLGLMGTHRSRLGGRLAWDATRITKIPVLFLAQWDDELVPRAEALDLFDRLGTLDKRLTAHPGKHTEVPVDVMRASQAFLAQRI